MGHADRHQVGDTGSLLDWHVSSDERAYDVNDSRATGKSGSATGGAIPERDARGGVHPKAFVTVTQSATIFPASTSSRETEGA